MAEVLRHTGTQEPISRGQLMRGAARRRGRLTEVEAAVARVCSLCRMCCCRRWGKRRGGVVEHVKIMPCGTLRHDKSGQ